MRTITILTPTYNRGKLLSELYESLQKQQDKDFEWLIIDDGSKDETKNIVEAFKAKSDFPIQYKYKENGGKHTALNYGYQYVTTPLVFIVDSDDRLTSDAIKSIKNVYQQYKEEADICGFSFLRGKPDGGYLSDSGVPKDGMKETFVECRINRRIGGDMAEVWYTHCLKEFPFPEYPGERFLGEDVVWIKMAEKYKMRFFNKVIYISDYLEDGLTNNRRRHNIASPRGCVTRAEVFLNSKVRWYVKIKSLIQYQIYGKFAEIKTQELLKNCNDKILFLMLFLPSRFLFYKWKRDYKKI